MSGATEKSYLDLQIAGREKNINNENDMSLLIPQSIAPVTQTFMNSTLTNVFQTVPAPWI